MAWRGSISKQVRELRIHLCQTSASSQGVRRYLRDNYLALKQANPTLPILIREAEHIRPAIFARYEYGRERQIQVDNLSPVEVEQQLKQLAE